MLPSSVRRLTSIAPQSPIISAIAATSSSRTAATSAVALSLSCRANRHQRRCSSSNPSRSDNGSKDLPADRSIAAQQSAKSSSNGEKRKRRLKGTAADRAALRALPSVPSTQHLPRESLALSAFFSLHRPISITHSLPKSVTDDAFASIFLPRTRSEKVSDVMSTLSQTVQNLEQPLANLGMGGQQQEPEAGDGLRRISLKHSDGSETSVYVQLNSMSGQFLPFSPPPIPEPEVAVAPSAAAESAVDVNSDSEPPHHHRVYRATLTIEETLDENGEFKYVAHSSELLEDSAPAAIGSPRTFLERMALRQLKFEEGQRHNDGMMAISVKRQRKLKMKKKKYKKLMKKTRNIRRKLDRN